MLPPDEEEFWKDLISLIEDGQVIPVIGERAVTTAPDDAPLYPELARKLAESLPVPPERLAGPPTLNGVAAEWLRGNGARKKLYLRVHRILQEEQAAPGSTLRELASISAFNLFITTTFDSLTERAVNDARFGGVKRTHVASFTPASPVDLPAHLCDLTAPTVYHLLGRVSSAPEYALWEEDALDFMCELHQRLNGMEKLAQALKGHGLLILGLNYSDWLVRFFLRIARQSRLSEPRTVTEYLAEGPMPESMVLFFGSIVKSICIVNREPAAFVSELGRRWRERHPDSMQAAARFSPSLPEEMVLGAIFLSYARDDARAAERLKASLKAAGCVVWLDRAQIKPAQDWKRALEEEINDRASLFVSLISRHTEGRAGEFHRERSWAEARQAREGGVIFYVPVLIDDMRVEEIQREVPLARRLDIALAPGGATKTDFSSYLFLLQKQRAPQLFPADS